MKKILIILLFVFNLSGNPYELADGREGRVHCRMPYSAIYPEHTPPIKKTRGVTTYGQRWTNWWSVQQCGWCSLLADKCSWLQKQKPTIKKEWTKTSQRKTVKLKVITLAKGKFLTFKLIDK